MDERDRAAGGAVVAQPAIDAIHVGQVGRPRALPAAIPALDLPLQEALGLAQVAQAQGIVVNRVELGQGVHQRRAHAAGGVGLVAEYVGHGAADDDAVSPLHDEERRADDGVVLTKEEGPWRVGQRPPQHRQDAVLAAHVVGRGSHRAERRPAQDVLVRAVVEQVGQVGRAAAELADDGRVVAAGQAAGQVVGQARFVEALVGADVYYVVHKEYPVVSIQYPVFSVLAT